MWKLLVCRAAYHYFGDLGLWFSCFNPAAILKFVFWLFYSVFLPPGVCVCRYLKVPMGNMGVFDPTEIHNRGQLKSHMKEAMIKLGYHLLCFFIYLYRWEHWNTWGKKIQPEMFSLSLSLSCHVLLFSSSMILALINDWSTPDPSALLTTPSRAHCSLKPACRMQSDQRSTCCVCCHQFHLLTPVKSGVSGTVHGCNSQSIVLILT